MDAIRRRTDRVQLPIAGIAAAIAADSGAEVRVEPVGMSLMFGGQRLTGGCRRPHGRVRSQAAGKVAGQRVSVRTAATSAAGVAAPRRDR
jgi:hypothetical protein